MKRIPGRALEIRYRRAGRDGGLYRHQFTGRVAMLARQDGSILLRGRARIWADDRGKGFARYTRERGNPMARRNGGGSGMMYLLLGAAGLYLLSSRQQAAPAPAAAPVVFYAGGGEVYPGANAPVFDYGQGAQDFDYGQSLAETAIAAGAGVAEGVISDFGDWLSGLLSPGNPLGVTQPS